MEPLSVQIREHKAFKLLKKLKHLQNRFRDNHRLLLWIPTIGTIFVQYRNSHCTALELKRKICIKRSIPVSLQAILLEGRELEDADEIHAEFFSRRLVQLTISNKGLSEAFNFLGQFPLDPSIDEDLTQKTEDGSHGTKGGEIWIPALGWSAYGLNFQRHLSKTSQESIDCMAISYCAVSSSMVAKIAKYGYTAELTELSVLKTEVCGVLSTPDPVLAQYMTPPFSVGERTYKVLLENRVRTATMNKYHIDDPHEGEVWVSTSSSDILPYRVLIKEVDLV